MWSNIKHQLIGSIISTALIAAGVAVWNVASNGTLISFLGGVTKTELDDVKARIVIPDNIEFKIAQRTVTQERERKIGGPEVILNGLLCPEGWLNGHGFSETYRDKGEVHRKYVRLCFRIPSS